MKIIAEYYDGRPIGIQLPKSLTFEVVETAPVMKTATKNGVVEAGEARERRDDQRAGIRRDGGEGSRESEHRRVHGSGEVTRLIGGLRRGITGSTSLAASAWVEARSRARPMGPRIAR